MTDVTATHIETNGRIYLAAVELRKSGAEDFAYVDGNPPLADEPFTVVDNHLRRHAAMPGAGVLCSAIRDREATTVSHHAGTVDVDCRECVAELTAGILA